MYKLIERLEQLRICEGDFFGKDYATQRAYEKANDMLDACLQEVYEFFQEYKVI